MLVVKEPSLSPECELNRFGIGEDFVIPGSIPGILPLSKAARLVFMLFGEFVVFLSGPFRDFFSGVRQGEGLSGMMPAGRALNDGVMQASHVFLFPSSQIQLLRAVPESVTLPLWSRRSLA